MKRFDIRGIEVEWNGYSLTWGGGFHSVMFPHEPTDDEVNAVLLGWDCGYLAGKQDGRSILQNDFRNLMGLQQ